MTVLLSLAAAMSWGSGDFFGGVAARFGRVTAVAAASQAVGVGTVLIVAPFLGGSPTGADLAWGAVAGLSGGVGLLFLYRGMAVAYIGLVAPVAAIGTAAFPLIFGVATGERPTAFELAGLAVGLLAIWLVSYERGARTGAAVTGLLYGLGAGAGFGGLLVGLSRITEDGGIWPLAPTRLTGALIIVAIALAGRERLVPLPSSWRAIVPAATLGTFGNVFFLYAAQDSLAVAAVVGSLFPGATVLLARLFLKEKLTPHRLAGVAAAIGAVGLISVG
jgi:drug/metabolite transporter (DMT)-like permease